MAKIILHKLATWDSTIYAQPLQINGWSGNAVQQVKPSKDKPKKPTVKPKKD